MTRSILFVTTLCIVITWASSGSPQLGQPLGLASANGSFRLNGELTAETCTLYEGSGLRTLSATTELHVHNGGSALLAPSTSIRVHANRVDLEAGEVQVSPTSRLQIGVERLMIDPAAGGVARIALRNSIVRVQSVRGVLGVRTESGVLIARLSEGQSIAMEPASSNRASVKLTGVIEKRKGLLLLEDKSTGVTFELLGAAVQGYVGEMVSVEGVVLDQNKPNVVTVSSAKRISAGGTNGPSRAVVAGVLVIAGAGTGLGLGLTRAEEPSTISRR